MCNKKAGFVVFFALLAVTISVFAQETLTITTYYPSPFGSYRELRSQRMAIGRNYLGSGITVTDDNLIVEGNIGVGLTGPNYKLQIAQDYNSPSNWHDTAQLVITGATNANEGIAMGFDTTDNYGYIYPRETGVTPRNLVLNPDGSNVGIGTITPGSRLALYDGGETTTQTGITQALTSAGLQISTDYTANAYTPGIFWQTANNNSTRPKAGIYLRETGSGTYMYFGTSNSYVTGVTNNAMVIDYAGNIGVGVTNPQAALDMGTGGIRLGGTTKTNWPSGARQVRFSVDGTANAGCSYYTGLKSGSFYWDPADYPGLVSFTIYYGVGGTNQGTTYVAMIDNTTSTVVSGTERTFNSDTDFVSVVVDTNNLVTGHYYNVSSRIPTNCGAIFGLNNPQFTIRMQ